jgi:hypothetical protein
MKFRLCQEKRLRLKDIFLAILRLITIPAVSVYVSNTLALAGGLTVGQFYRSGADPDVVSVVH